MKENFDFDKVSFDELDLDDLSVSKLECDEDIKLNLSELNDDVDIPASVPLSPRHQASIAQNIEEMIFDLIESGDKNSLLRLTGDRPDFRASMNKEVEQDFISDYLQACSYNPAIKWYSKLANILTPKQFQVEGGVLHISMPKSVFKKAIIPFLGDFDRKYYTSSPIVRLVLDCSDMHFRDEVLKVQKLQKQSKQNRTSSEDISVENSELNDLWDTDEVKSAGNMRVDDNNSLNQSEIMKVQATIIKLSDLSNKAIANYLLDKKMLGASAKEKLEGEISDKARRNEILTILQLMQKNPHGQLRYLTTVSKKQENPNKDDFGWDKE